MNSEILIATKAPIKTSTISSKEFSDSPFWKAGVPIIWNGGLKWHWREIESLVERI